MHDRGNGQAGLKKWENWAGNVTANPECYFIPDTLEDVVNIVKQASAQSPKKKIRVVGSSHSWSALAQTDEYMVSMEQFCSIQLDPTTGLVTVGAGAVMGEVEEYLKSHGLAIPANAVTLMPRIGGLVAAGCHGSGYEYSIVSDYVQAVSMVLASGETRTFSTDASDDDPDLMDAVRLNLGTFGIMYEIVLKPVPTFNVHCVDSTPDMARTIANLQQIVTENEYVEIFWFPFNPDNAVWLKTWNKTAEDARPSSQRDFWERIENQQFSAADVRAALLKAASPEHVIKLGQEFLEGLHSRPSEGRQVRVVEDRDRQSTAMPEWLLCLADCIWAGGDDEQVMKCMEGCLEEGGENLTGADLWAFVAEHPGWTPFVLSLLWHLVPDRDDYVAPVNDVMHFRRFFPRVALMAMAIPIEPDFGNVKQAWNLAVEAVHQAALNRQYPLNVNIEARFVKNSNCLLSPINGSDHFCIIEVISYITTPTFDDFYAAIGQKWLQLGWNGCTPRPHWPKQFDAIPNINQIIRQAYGDKLTKFLQIRDGLDPDRMFVNRFLEGIFYGD